jgi:ATP diphosphatase
MSNQKPNPSPDDAPSDAMDALLRVMARLRDSKTGCPWDKEQDFATIAPYTIEEAYEVADAIERGDMAALKDELGDLLFQVVFYAEMAQELGAFDFHDIVRGITEKMVRRHPHVFGERAVISELEQRAAWERHKADERKRDAAEHRAKHGALDGVARALPALMRACKLQRRAAREGFDWPDLAPVFAKIEEEITEVRAELSKETKNQDAIREEIGDLLFACVNLARHLDTDPEAALRHGNDKFEARFRAVEAELARRGSSPAQSSLAEMDEIWDEVKRAEAASRL